MKTHPGLFLFALGIALSLAGAVALMVGTRWGIGISPDSAVYIDVAQNLRRGHGLSVSAPEEKFIPMTHYPPLFPLGLALTANLGLEPLDGARLLNAVLLAGNSFSIGLLLYLSTQTVWPSLFGSFLMISSLPVVQVHSMAWSEPLFLFFALLGLTLLALFLETPKWSFFTGSCAAVALSVLTRYAGFALVAAGIVGILWLGRHPWKRKLAAAGAFAALSSLPITLWMARNLAVSGTATDRELAIHLPTVDHAQAALNVIARWFLPSGTAPGWLELAIVATFGLLVFLLVRAQKSQVTGRNLGRLPAMPSLLMLFVVAYGLLLVVSLSILDAHILIDSRSLAPVYVATIVLVICLLANLWHSLQSGLARILCVSIALVLSTSQITQTASWLGHGYREGFGYGSRSWKQSKLINYLRLLVGEAPVFTNGADAVRMLTGRPAYFVPSKLDAGTRRANKRYSFELFAMEKKLRERNGVLVYFDTIRWRSYLPSSAELERALPLQVQLRGEDGTVYKIKN